MVYLIRPSCCLRATGDTFFCKKIKFFSRDDESNCASYLVPELPQFAHSELHEEQRGKDEDWVDGRAKDRYWLSEYEHFLRISIDTLKNHFLMYSAYQ